MNKKERQRSSTLNSLDKLRSLNLRTSIDLSHSVEVKFFFLKRGIYYCLKVQDVCKCFEFTNDQLHVLMEKMNISFEEGLRSETGFFF